MTYSFRHRLAFGTRVGIESPSYELVLEGASSGNPRVSLHSLIPDPSKPISDSRQLVLIGQGYGSEADAEKAAAEWRSVVTLAFAATQIGADFGDRAPRSGGASDYFLQQLAEQNGGGPSSVRPPRSNDLQDRSTAVFHNNRS